MCLTLSKEASGKLARWQRLMAVVEIPYEQAIEAEKNRVIELVAREFQRERQITEVQFDGHVTVMRRLQDTYGRVAIRLALNEALAVGLKAHVKDWDKLWLYLVQRWVSEYGGAMALETATTTRNDIQRIISAALGVEEEFNPASLVEAILAVRDLSRSRARTIARTETHNAMMFAADEGARKLARDNGLRAMKRWLPVQDERTRANHSAMANHPAIPMDADFNVGGVKMSRPADPRGGAANNINCRCVLTYSVSE